MTLAKEETLVSLPYSSLTGGGVEGSNLRRWLPEPSKAVFGLAQNNDGSVDTKHTLSEARRMGVGTLPMLRLAGGDVLIRIPPISKVKGRGLVWLVEDKAGLFAAANTNGIFFDNEEFI